MRRDFFWGDGEALLRLQGMSLGDSRKDLKGGGIDYSGKNLTMSKWWKNFITSHSRT